VKRLALALPSPYVGLRPFTERESLLFFGRESHVAALLRTLERKQRFTAIVGASGTGKSSLILAGLIPALHRGALSSVGSRWNVVSLKPGNAPLANLARALISDDRWLTIADPATAVSYLVSLLSSSPLALVNLYRERAQVFEREAMLLLVDQFEEIFRYRQRNIDQAEAFINLLLRTASEPDVPIYVVLTMRSDFLGNCVAFHGLPEAINTGIYLTPRLNRDQLASVIASPVKLVGGEIEPPLVASLLNALGGEDELPVLEHALLRMWDRARAFGRTKIESADFEAVCKGSPASDKVLTPETDGIGDTRLIFALDNHAQGIYSSLTDDQQRVARRVFLSLAERRDGRDVRRPQSFGELLTQVGEDRKDDLVGIIEAFRAEGAGFLQPAIPQPIHDGTTIDISHESLIRLWSQFQAWLREEEIDVADLREWHLRASKRIDAGGGLLDENDTRRAQQWMERVSKRGDPTVWLARFITGSQIGVERIFGYIGESAAVFAARNRKKKIVRRMRYAALLIFPFCAYFLAGPPPPPGRIVMATDAPKSTYYLKQYQQYLARNGVSVELRTSQGSMETATSMFDPASGVDVALIRGGVMFAANAPDLVSLGNMYQQQLWVFYRGRGTIQSLSELRGKRIAIGPETDDVRALALQLLALHGAVLPPTSLLSLGGKAALEALEKGSVDAVFVIGGPEANSIARALSTPGVKVFSDAEAVGHARNLPYLSVVTLPASAIDLSNHIPPRDVTLLAANVMLMARSELHPAMMDLLLQAATEIHSGGDLFHRAGEFPNGDVTDFPLPERAERFYKSGRPALWRYLPFWAANLAETLIPPLIIVFVLFIPFLIFAGVFYAAGARLYEASRRLLKRPRRRAYGASLQ
jgi:TRAP-type uncharacterized transport system substrate-binding protein